jgi:hypothetical protein
VNIPTAGCYRKSGSAYRPPLLEIHLLDTRSPSSLQNGKNSGKKLADSDSSSDGAGRACVMPITPSQILDGSYSRGQRRTSQHRNAPHTQSDFTLGPDTGYESEEEVFAGNSSLPFRYS